MPNAFELFMASERFILDFETGSLEYKGQLDPNNTAAIIQFMDRHWTLVYLQTGWWPQLLFQAYPEQPYLAFWAAAFITYWQLSQANQN